jgi:hypothetical protein
MRSQFILICCSLALVFAGCAKKESTLEVKEAFKAVPPGPQKTMAEDAVAAFEKKDYPTAVENLSVLRSDPNLSPEQSRAVLDKMEQIQTELANRADAGDKQALETLRMMQSRTRR